jgi:PGF-pre-PGF domain-containing protein
VSVLNKKGIVKIGFFVLFLAVIVVLILYVIPTFADVYPGDLRPLYGDSICGGNQCPAWVNLTRGDMFFTDNNTVFIVVNYSCSFPSICNESMTVTGNFSEIGGNSNVQGIFKLDNGTSEISDWAIFELNDTVNFTAVGSILQMQPKNITLNVTGANDTSYNDQIVAVVMLVNMSTFGCPSADSNPQFPMVLGYNISNSSPVLTPQQAVGCTQNTTLCQYMDTYGPGTWNGTDWIVCAPNFGGATTNLTSIAETGNFSAIPNFTIEVPGKAKIVFQTNVSFDSQERSQAIMEFAMKSTMGGGRIGLNDSEFCGDSCGQTNRPNLNLTARLTIYNISGQVGQITGRPQIFKYVHGATSGIPCPPSICSDFVWDGENLTFTVSSFSDYGLTDTINVTLQTPSNLSYTNTLNLNFTYTPEWNDSITMKNCTLYGNFTGNWVANETNTSELANGTINWINNTVDSDGYYLWNIYCFDNTSQYDYYSPNWTVIVDTVEPTFENNNSNTSSINSTQPVLIYANWSDDNNLSYAWLSTNETGDWFNYTDGTYNSPIDINLTSGETWSNFTWDNNTFESGVVAWKIYANDSAGNENVTGEMTLSVNDTTPPMYSNNSTNTTLAGIATLFSLYWQDNSGLSGYIFQFCNCTWNGTHCPNSTDDDAWLNISWQPMTGLTNWSNFTHTPNYTAGCNVSWKVYANDTSDNWNSSVIYNYTTKNATGLYCTLGAQCIGGYCVHNVCRAASTYCGDSHCDSGEDCSSCSADCGACSSYQSSSGTTTGISGSTYATPYVILKPGKVNITLSSLTTSGKMIATIARFEDVAIREMNITVVNNVANIKIMISKLSILPSTVFYDIDGKVYHYINIERINITDSDINTVNFEFAVNKTWLTDNNVDASNITLYRWANNKWNDLSAVKINESTQEVFYNANSPGLSVFIIGTKGGAPEVEETSCVESWSCTDWSACANNQQTRTCTDSNSCGTTVNKPAESQACETEEAVAGAKTISILTSVIIIIAAIIICIFIFLERVKITFFLETLVKKAKSIKRPEKTKEKVKAHK